MYVNHAVNLYVIQYIAPFRIFTSSRLVTLHYTSKYIKSHIKSGSVPPRERDPPGKAYFIVRCIYTVYIRGISNYHIENNMAFKNDYRIFFYIKEKGIGIEGGISALGPLTCGFDVPINFRQYTASSIPFHIRHITRPSSHLKYTSLPKQANSPLPETYNLPNLLAKNEQYTFVAFQCIIGNKPSVN